MNRQFTLRLNPVQNERLQELKEILNSTTDAGTIKHLIENHAKMKREIEDLKSENFKLKRNNEQMKEYIETFVLAFKNLSKLAK